MKIEGWQIEGFGIFQDWEVRCLPDGLTVFLGPNEAGKSTLLAFLRGALFGFPSGRSRSPRYPPQRGGRHGGRLMLRGPEGEMVVERLVTRKNGLRVNGRESAGEELRDMLGGADENVFRSVFAFSLSEMQSFEWLKAEQVRERIFSAGISGAGASARHVIETLDAEASALYRTRGASRVRELLDRIQDAERRWQDAQAEADRYSSLELEQEKWTARAMALSAEEQELRRKQRALEAAIELWAEYTQGQEQLAAHTSLGEFPSDPESRFAALNGRVEAARAALRRLEEERSAVERSRAQFSSGLDDRLLLISDRVEEFHARLALHQERLKDFLAARVEQEGSSSHWRFLGLGLGACVAFAGGWLTARGEVAGGLAAVFVGLFAAGLWLYLQVNRRERLRAKLAGLEQEVAGWEQPVREWSGSSNSAERLIADFLNLRDRCHNDGNIRTKLAALDEAAAGARAQLEAARSEFASAEDALRVFLRESGAADEAGFQSRLRLFRDRQRLSALIQERESRVAALAETLSSGRAEEWRNELSRLLERLTTVQSQRDEAVGEQRVAEAARRQIAESTAIPAIKAEVESLHSELAVAVREWRVAKLAKELVGRTLQEFTRTRQPAVLEEASAAFARVTAGAYERILQSHTVCREPYARNRPYRQNEDGESLVALDRGGQRKRPEELSRGTVEQLYLCIRLALAAEFARRTAALPLIMDDVLVNFDPDRAAAVARELAHFSRQHQVLVFTCHPETALLFTEVAPETNIVHMGRHDRLSAAK